MLQLTTKQPQHLIFDIDAAFSKLKFKDMKFIFSRALSMSKATSAISLDNLPDDITPEAIGIKTPFGFTNLNNIPNGVKAYVLACIAIRDKEQIYLPECVFGSTVRKALAEACKNTSYVTLYAPQGYFTSAYFPLSERCEVLVCIDGEVKQLTC